MKDKDLKLLAEAYESVQVNEFLGFGKKDAPQSWKVFVKDPSRITPNKVSMWPNILNQWKSIPSKHQNFLRDAFKKAALQFFAEPDNVGSFASMLQKADNLLGPNDYQTPINTILSKLKDTNIEQAAINLIDGDNDNSNFTDSTKWVENLPSSVYTDEVREYKERIDREIEAMVKKVKQSRKPRPKKQQYWDGGDIRSHSGGGRWDKV